MKYIIKVLRKHIKAGKKIDCRKCPVALAIKQAIPRSNPTVCFSFCDVTVKNKRRKMVCMPEKTRRFIENFDDGRNVIPFKFQLEI